jgi:hypothetical protein
MNGLARISNRSPCLTCEAVLSECFFLLGHSPSGKKAFSALLERGIIRVEFSLREQLVLHLIQQYQDTPMSFADVCMVRTTELLQRCSPQIVISKRIAGMAAKPSLFWDLGRA